MIFFRSLIVGVLLSILTSGAALAQCGTTAPANKFCGNDTGSSALATWKSIPPTALSAIAGGTVLGNRTGASAVPVATTAPVFGIPGTSTGQIGLAGATSGTSILKAQPAAGSAISLLPTTAGTLVSTSTAPLTINATTGAISVTGLAGGVLAGAGPAFSISPVFGVPGASQGSLGFAGATSGTVTVQAQATAGTATLTLPNTSGTVAANASAPLALSATTGTLTCPTCVTSSGGGAISGTAPIAVSAAGVVSINAPYGTLTASNGGIVYSGATNLAILAGTATTRQMLQSGASTTPAWSTATWPATTAAGTVLTSASANTVTATSAPVLGVAGTTVGSLGFQNATSGTVTLQPVTGALGTPTINIPAASGTMAVSATAPVTLSAAGAIGVTSAALTKTDDTNVTLTLTGTPASALLQSVNIAAGWTGTLSTARMGAPFTNGTASGNTAKFATVKAGTLTTNHIASFDVNGNIQDNTDISVTTGALSNTSGIAITASNTNANACSGCIGDYVDNPVGGGATAGTTVPGSGAVTNVNTLSLGAGDWMVSCGVNILPNATLIGLTEVHTSLSTDGSSLTGSNYGGPNAEHLAWQDNQAQIRMVGPARWNNSSTRTVYCNQKLTYSGGSALVQSWMFAYRFH